jgi:hypothetical protein
LERQTAEALKGKRISRGADFSKEDVDVVIPDFPFLRVDAKYRVRHAHHTFIEEIRSKYCANAQEIPVLVTKHHQQSGAYATIPLEFLGMLLDAVRSLKRDDYQESRKPKASEVGGIPGEASAEEV